jgi:hypothetical protein
MKNVKPIIKTELIKYNYDISIPEQAKKFKKIVKIALKNKLRIWKNHIHINGNCMVNFSGPVELETKFLFSNQWNTKTGYRVFDFVLTVDKYKNSIRAGYYLKQTKEIKQLRQDIKTCQYCGKLYFKPSQKFCSKCLNSEYLKIDDLKLLRLQSININKKTFPELTKKEKAFLLPKYKKAQLLLNNKKIKENYKKIEIEKDKLINRANIEYKGFKWLLDKGLNIDNVIFYDHSQVFCFGWKNGIEKSLISDIKQKLVKFPFAYEIKTA